jgi:hypothetical protein
MLVEQAEQQLE